MNTTDNCIEIDGKLDLLLFLVDLLEIDINENKVISDDGDEVTDEKLVEKAINCHNLLQNKDFKILWEMLEFHSQLTIVIESNYIDRVYRDSYYSYYSRKHFEYNRFCKRIFLFDRIKVKKSKIFNTPERTLENAFIGFIVIRPLQFGKIGRSLLNPFKISKPSSISDIYLRYASYSATMFGKRLKIKAFPYSTQDEETTSCAEITILNLLDYFSTKYAEYKYLLPSDITDIAIRNGYERKLPSKGLDYLLISKIFMEVGFSPVLYNTSKLENFSKFKRIMHYYVESGIPIAIGLMLPNEMRHAIVCIGHGKVDHSKLGSRRYSISNNKSRLWIIDTADLISDYVVMDDNQKPYSLYTWQDNYTSTTFGDTMTPEFLMVPLYKHMFLEAADAYDICTSILADENLGIKTNINSQNTDFSSLGEKENPIVIRLFMASARGFKHQRINYFSKINKEIKELYLNTPFPKFVWVCEIYKKCDYSQNMCCGEIIIDATSTSHATTRSIILLHYPYKAIQQLPNNENNSLFFQPLEKWEYFLGYRGNLKNFSIMP